MKSKARVSGRLGGMLIKNFILIGGSFILMMLLMLVMVINYSTSAVLEQARETNNLMLTQLIERIDGIIKNTRLKLIQLGGADETREYLRDSTLFADNYSRYENTNRLLHLMVRDTLYSEYFESIYLYCISRDELLTDEFGPLPRSAIADKSWYDMSESFPPNQVVPPALRLLTSANYTKYTLTLMQQTPLLINARQGMFVVNLDISRLFAGGGDAPYVVLDETDTIIACSDMSLVGLKADATKLPAQAFDESGQAMFEYKGESALSSVKRSPSTRWKYVLIDTLGTYNERISQLRGVVILAILVLMPIALIAAYALSKRMYMPVKRVLAMLDERDDITSSLMPGRRDEMAYLSQTVVRMLNRNKTLNQTLEERLTLLNDARLKMLQNQMNPHFLYNTLESINWMALERMRGDNEVSDAICTLSELLRDCLRSAPIVKLDEEIIQAQRYVKIQKLRFGDGLNAVFEADERARGCAVPSMTLQPILENSIKYGLRERIETGAGEVIVRAALDKGALNISVTDNGDGMPRDALSELRGRLKDTGTGTQHGEHIGLANVQQRLHILFGAGALVNVDNLPDGGFKVEICIPQFENSDRA